MSTVKQLNLKIQELQKKKKQLQERQARGFFDGAQSILGDEFSPEFALAMIESAWDKATKADKEAWQKASGKFLKKGKPRFSKTSPQK
ncbi:hypothetical protein OAN22_02160 [Alphaproteobacteria bacterium]|nr:hypothetical protein [Alphaproteobacteria bacterium]